MASHMLAAWQPDARYMGPGGQNWGYQGVAAERRMTEYETHLVFSNRWEGKKRDAARGARDAARGCGTLDALGSRRVAVYMLGGEIREGGKQWMLCASGVDHWAANMVSGRALFI